MTNTTVSRDIEILLSEEMDFGPDDWGFRHDLIDGSFVRFVWDDAEVGTFSLYRFDDRGLLVGTARVSGALPVPVIGSMISAFAGYDEV